MLDPRNLPPARTADPLAEWRMLRNLYMARAMVERMAAIEETLWRT